MRRRYDVVRPPEPDVPSTGEYAGEDLFQVTKDGPDAYIVRHFPNVTFRAPCCVIRVTVNDADRLHRFDFEITPGATHALARVMRRVDQKHGRVVDNKSVIGQTPAPGV